MPGTTWGTAEAISGQTGSVSGTDTNSNYWWWVFTGEEGLAYDFAISGDASGHCWIGGTGENNYDATSSFQIPDPYGRPTVRLSGAGTTPVHIGVEYSSGPFTITWSVALHATPETAQPFSGESGSLDYGSDQWCVFTPEPGMLYTFTAPTRMSLYTNGTSTGDYKVLGYGDVMVPGGDQPLYLHSDAGSTGTLTWTSAPDTDTNPNDTWQTATPIDGSTGGSIAYEDAHHDRQEWFLLNAQVGSFYLFSCDEPNGYYEVYGAPTGAETAPSYISYGYEPDAHLGFTAEVEQYYVVVYPSYAGATGTLTWTLEAPPDPPPYVVANDLQENAVVIDVTANGSITYDNTGATGTPDTQDLRTIWFKLTPAVLMRFAVTATPPVSDSYAEPVVSLIGADLYSTSESNAAAATLPAHVDTYVKIAFPWGNQGLWSQGTLSWTVTPVPDNALPTGAVDITTAPRQPIAFEEGASPEAPRSTRSVRPTLMAPPPPRCASTTRTGRRTTAPPTTAAPRTPLRGLSATSTRAISSRSASSARRERPFSCAGAWPRSRSSRPSASGRTARSEPTVRAGGTPTGGAPLRAARCGRARPAGATTATPRAPTIRVTLPWVTPRTRAARMRALCPS
jgi:hypothetical protein